MIEQRITPTQLAQGSGCVKHIYYALADSKRAKRWLMHDSSRDLGTWEGDTSVVDSLQFVMEL